MASTEFVTAVNRHLSDCHINQKKFNKLSKILRDMASKASDEEGMLLKFTNKCYASEKDRSKAKEQAKLFLDTLFGSISTLYKDGPKPALEKRVKALQKSTEASSTGKAYYMERIGGSDQKDEWDGTFDDDSMYTMKLDRFKVGPTLGVGGTAKVRLGLDTSSGKQVAVKILKPRYAKHAMKEIKVLEKMKHPNIIELHSIFERVYQHKSQAPTTIFVIEFANEGELIEYLMYTGKFEAQLARWFFKDLIAAVEYCHKQGYAHRDLKHDNCLLGDKFTVKVTDFGFATDISGNPLMKTAIGTEQYAAPEILSHTKYDKSVDVFAMGVMLFIALAGCQPFKRADKKDRWYGMIMGGDWKKFWKYHKKVHAFAKDAQDLLQKMLDPDPSKRITVEGMKNHGWTNKSAYTQEEAADKLQKRKKKVDKAKFGQSQPMSNGSDRALEPHRACAPFYWAKNPKGTYNFKSDKEAELVKKNMILCLTDAEGINGNAEDVVEERLKRENAEEKDDSFDLGAVLSDQDMDDGDDEYNADGSLAKWNVKFHVNVNKKDLYGQFRIYTEQLDETAQGLLKEKYEIIKKAEELKAEALAGGKTAEEAETIFQKFVGETPLSNGKPLTNTQKYYAEGDREDWGLSNIIVVNQRADPNIGRGEMAKGFSKVLKGTTQKTQLFAKFYQQIVVIVGNALMKIET